MNFLIDTNIISEPRKPADRRNQGVEQWFTQADPDTLFLSILMARANPAWMPRKMGHSLKVFYEVYATWIEGQDGDAQMEKVETFLAAEQNV